MTERPSRIVAQIRKELLQLARDPVALTLALFLPAVLMLLLGTAISLDVKDIPITIQDLDQTPMSRAYLDFYRASLSFRVGPGSLDSQPERALLENRARAVVIIPQHFERNLRHGQQAEVQVLIDATDANTANVLRGSVSALTSAYNQQIRPYSRQTGAPIEAQIRLLYNPGRSDRDFIGPGAMAVVLALLPPLLASLAMSREMETKTILQVYVSGVSAFEFLLGKVLSFWLVAAADWLILMVVAAIFFGFRIHGDPSCLLVGTACFLFCTMSFGTMVGSLVRNQASSMQVMQLGGFVLSFLLSGFIFPVNNIPPALRWLSAITPARYYIEILRDSFLRGGGWPASGLPILALCGLGAIFFIRAWRGMRPMQLSA